MISDTCEIDRGTTPKRGGAERLEVPRHQTVEVLLGRAGTRRAVFRNGLAQSAQVHVALVFVHTEDEQKPALDLRVELEVGVGAVDVRNL